MADPARTLAHVPPDDRARGAGALAEVERLARDLRHEVNTAGSRILPLSDIEVAGRLARLRDLVGRAEACLRERVVT